MKFNLKNRPKRLNLHYKVYDAEDVDSWFEGFENQIRELLDAEKQNYETAVAMATDSLDRNDLLSHSWGRIQLLKQILGYKLKTETKP